MFYKKLFYIGLPLIIRNSLSSFSGFIDNLMVGQLGNEAISAVSIINQIFFIFICMFWGCNAVIGAFSTQFFGVKDYVGVSDVFYIKALYCFTLFFIFSVFLYVFYDKLLYLYMTNVDDVGRATILNLCNEYKFFSYISLIPHAITGIFTSTISESGTTFLAMLLCLVSTLVNIILNYLLIDGHFGFPQMGVLGASIATFISRVVELCLLFSLLYRFKFFSEIFANIRLNLTLVLRVFKRVIPAFFNEFLFSFSFIVRSQIYSIQSINNVVVMSIVSTLFVLFYNIVSATAVSSEIIIGHELGKANFDGAFENAKKALFVILIYGLICGFFLYNLSFTFPNIYSIDDETRLNVTRCIQVLSVNFYLMALTGVMCGILRSGGRTILLFIIDGFYLFVVAIPAQFLLVRFTNLPIYKIYFIVLLLNVFRCLIGFYFVKKRIWIRKIISS